jgi:hypothetical protein
MATVCTVATPTKYVELKKNTPYNVGGNKNIYMLCCIADKIKESIDVFYVYKLFTTIVVNVL